MSDQYDRGEQKRHKCTRLLFSPTFYYANESATSQRRLFPPPCAYQNSSPTPTETACLHTFSVPHVYSSLLFCAW